MPALRLRRHGMLSLFKGVYFKDGEEPYLVQC